MRAPVFVAVVALVQVAVLLGGSARAQTSCPVPDALCTGDPWSRLGEVFGGSCDLDFGGRALVDRRRPGGP
jgi:hypothetical protein